MQNENDSCNSTSQNETSLHMSMCCFITSSTQLAVNFRICSINFITLQFPQLNISFFLQPLSIVLSFHSFCITRFTKIWFISFAATSTLPFLIVIPYNFLQSSYSFSILHVMDHFSDDVLYYLPMFTIDLQAKSSQSMQMFSSKTSHDNFYLIILSSSFDANAPTSFIMCGSPIKS